MEDWLLIPSILFIIFIRLIGELFFRGGLYWFILLLSVVLVWLAAKLGWVVGWWRKLAGVVALFVVINIPFVWQPLRAYLYFNELCAKHVPLRVYEPIVLGPDDFHEDGWPKFIDKTTWRLSGENWGEYVVEDSRERLEYGSWMNIRRVYDKSGEVRFETRSIRSGVIRKGLGRYYASHVSFRRCHKDSVNQVADPIERGDPMKILDGAFEYKG